MATQKHKHLVIVESPAKAKTIERYLGSDYKVLASYGHVRQLPRKSGSIDVEHGFAPLYEPIDGNKKHIAAIKKALKDADDLYLATDLDREGEAIAWHVAELVKPKPGQTKRITFNEITKSAVTAAVANPRQIDSDLVAAQEARQGLDYLYGFTLSPFLWKKIRYGLSAGRVQSVALRLVVEREREIEAFNPKEYWTLDALLRQPEEPNEALARFGASISADRGSKLGQFDLTEARAKELAGQLPEHPVTVASVETKQRKRSPSPPFTTSTLQQEASRKLGFAARRTMRAAQGLYEAGQITYMRTDSLNMAQSAVAEARASIKKQYGADYVPAEPRYYKNKSKGAQEAHEAIRPTSFAKSPDSLSAALDGDQRKLYGLVWKRAIASQIADAQLDATTATFSAGPNGEVTLKATGSQVKFPGFIKVYLEGRDDAQSPADDAEKLLPPLATGQKIELESASPEQHFTQPPPRFSEASLVKTLEEHGIGRPSTYASILSTLQERRYARLEERRFFPEEVGLVVSDLLTTHFTKYVDYGFTASLEDELDEVAEGRRARVELLGQWWGPFKELVDAKDKTVKKEDVTQQATDQACPTCEQGKLVIKLGRFGKFYGCSRFPECKHMSPLESEAAAQTEAEQAAANEQCPECGSPMVAKRGRFGTFLGCSKYPDCKGTKQIVKSTGVSCPQCKEGELAAKQTKRKRTFYGCSRYPKCDFAVWQEPVKEPCPKCQHLVTKRGKDKIACTKCEWEAETAEEPAEAAA